MSGPLRFQNIVFSIDDCPALDESEPVVAELTSRGDLVIHNYDRDVDNAALALGMEPEDLPCMLLEEKWEEIVGLGQLQLLHNLPIKIRAEALRVIGEITRSGKRALKLADYSSPSRGKESAGYDARRVHLRGLNPVDEDFVVGQVQRMTIHSGIHSMKTVVSLAIDMYVTIQGYMDVQNLIRDGVITDQKRKRLAVVSIEEIFDDDRMAVRVGHQGRDLKITTRTAIIERVGKLKKKTWQLVMWL